METCVTSPTNGTILVPLHCLRVFVCDCSYFNKEKEEKALYSAVFSSSLGLCLSLCLSSLLFQSSLASCHDGPQGMRIGILVVVVRVVGFPSVLGVAGAGKEGTALSILW